MVRTAKKIFVANELIRVKREKLKKNVHFVFGKIDIKF